MTKLRKTGREGKAPLVAKMDEWEPPADMERRRLAGLERFKRKNPDYTEVKSKPQQLQIIPTRIPTRNGNSNRGQLTVVGPLKAKAKAKVNENRWSLQTTLELLDEIKAFVRSRKVKIGTRIEDWELVASQVSNPYGVELEQFAQSCKTKFLHLRRYRGDKRGRVGAEVKDSMAEYDQICARFAQRNRSLSSPSSPGTQKEILIVLTDSEEEVVVSSHPSADATEPQPAAECPQKPAERTEKLSLSSAAVVNEIQGGRQGPVGSSGLIRAARRRKVDGPGSSYSIMTRARSGAVGESLNRSVVTSTRSEICVDKQRADSNDLVVLETGLGRLRSSGTLPPVTEAGPMRGCPTRTTLSCAPSDKSVEKEIAEGNNSVVRKTGVGRVGSPGTPPPMTKARPIRECRTRKTLDYV